MGMSGKLWKGSGWAVAKLWTALDGVLEAALERILMVLDGFTLFWTAWKPLDCSLELVRSLPDDQNGLLDHLALKGSKSSFCQVQLCIKVVLF